jgi:microcin C transport system substrate-binding protein
MMRTAGSARQSARCAAILLLSALLLSLGPFPVRAELRHGLSVFGELKYPPDFAHFDYVNPNAPKGGRIALIGEGANRTFDSFQGYILKGSPAQRLDLLFDSLMARALDEPDAVYGLVAHSAEVAEDRMSVTFYLRPEARFADGSALTAHDVAFSIMALKDKGHPGYALALRGVDKAEVIDAQTVRFIFAGGNVRDLPLIIAQMPIFSKAYYELRPFDETTLVPPLGSGPYEIADFKQGTFVTYRRRKDYWARDLPLMRGLYNFDEIRFEYYRDRTAELEALKAGNYDFREEFTSKTWATEYDIPQVRSGRIKRETLPDGRPGGAQGWFINLRREKFADVRVRKALNYAFDFEWSNKQLFYDLYKRTQSYFENTDLKAVGRPSPGELALLEPFRAQLPPEVFEEVYIPPVSDGSGRNREALRIAYNLLTEAGWVVKDGRRVNAKGEPLVVEFIIDEPSFERVTAPFARNLRLLGIEVVQRRVDSAQYQNRRKTFDFDLYVARFILPPTPGIEMKNYWGSESAGAQGSNNLAGIADPVVDALTAKMLNATSREDLRTAARALDRVLRAGHYWVPHWYKNFHNIAYWDKFSRPASKPPFSRAVIETWWFDPGKAQQVAQGN